MQAQLGGVARDEDSVEGSSGDEDTGGRDDQG